MSPSQTERPRHEIEPADLQGIALNRLGGDEFDQEFFVEWQVPQGAPATESPIYQARPDPLSVDLRGVGAFLVGDFDPRSG